MATSRRAAGAAGPAGHAQAPVEKPAPFNFAAFRNAYFDQVVDDNDLPPLATKLVWRFLKDCRTTFERQGSVHSFRGQESYAERLGIKSRHVRALFAALRDRGHAGVKRGGKGHPNITYPILFDRQKNAGQDNGEAICPPPVPLLSFSDDPLTGTDPAILGDDIDPLTGILVHVDRHSNGILIGPKGPGNLCEESYSGESLRTGVPPRSEMKRSTVDSVAYSRLRGRSAPEGALSTRVQIPESIRVGSFITVADLGRRRVADIDLEGRTVTTPDFDTVELGADGVWRSSEIPF